MRAGSPRTFVRVGQLVEGAQHVRNARSLRILRLQALRRGLLHLRVYGQRSAPRYLVLVARRGRAMAPQTNKHTGQRPGGLWLVSVRRSGAQGSACILRCPHRSAKAWAHSQTALGRMGCHCGGASPLDRPVARSCRRSRRRRRPGRPRARQPAPGRPPASGAPHVTRSSLQKRSTRTSSQDALRQTMSQSMGVWLGLSMSKLSQKGAGRPPSVGGGLTLLQSSQGRTALVLQAHQMQQACHMAHKDALRVRSPCMQREVGPARGRASSSTSAPSASTAARQRFGASSSRISAHSDLQSTKQCMK